MRAAGKVWWACVLVAAGCEAAGPKAHSEDSGAGDSEGESGDSDGDALWAQVEASGGREACGLTRRGRVLCWGEHGSDELPPDSEGWRELSFSSVAACALDADGMVDCWWVQFEKWDDQDVVDPPVSPLHGISVGREVGCGLDERGALTCWGATELPEWEPPTGTWESVDIGAVACAIGVDGGLECWGSKALHDVSATFVSVTVGSSQIVALDERGVAHCYAGNYADTCDVPEGYRFTMVDAGNEGTCGITTDGDLVCWFSQKGYGVYDIGPDEPQPGPWVDVSVGGAGVCAVRADGEMVCFVPENGYLADIPDPG